MYQQWCQENDARAHRWLDFVELVSKNTSVAQDEIIRQLQKTYWFEWGDQ
jgi:hypothetical protein